MKPAACTPADGEAGLLAAPHPLGDGVHPRHRLPPVAAAAATLLMLFVVLIILLLRIDRRRFFLQLLLLLCRNRHPLGRLRLLLPHHRRRVRLQLLLLAGHAGRLDGVHALVQLHHGAVEVQAALERHRARLSHAGGQQVHEQATEG